MTRTGKNFKKVNAGRKYMWNTKHVKQHYNIKNKHFKLFKPTSLSPV